MPDDSFNPVSVRSSEERSIDIRRRRKELFYALFFSLIGLFLGIAVLVISNPEDFIADFFAIGSVLIGFSFYSALTNEDLFQGSLDTIIP